MGRFIAWGCLLLLSFFSFAQVNSDFHENSLPVKQTVSFRSAVLLPKKSFVSLGTIVYEAKLLGIAKHYLNGVYVLDETKGQSVGLQVHQKKRGNLISETSAKIAYRQEVKIENRNSLFLATNLGFYQILLRSAPQTAGGSDIVFNIDWAASYGNEDWMVSTYFGNTTLPELVLYEEIILYDRYYGGYLEKNIKLINLLLSSIQVNMYFQASELYWRSTFEQEVFENIYLAMNGNRKSIGISGAIKNIDFGSSLLTYIYFGYAFPISDAFTNAFTPFQIQLGISRDN